jgi:hypothetical protein
VARRGYLGPGIIALVALAAVALVVNFVGLSHRSPHTLSRNDAATLISQGLQAQQGGSSRPQVSCPVDEPVRAGVQFECTLHHPDGSSQQIQVTETDASGDLHFTVLAPR